MGSRGGPQAGTDGEKWPKMAKDGQKWPKIEISGEWWENRVVIAWISFLSVDFIVAAPSVNINTHKGRSPFDKHWNDFMSKNELTCCDSHYPVHSITYHHKSLDQKKWIDHFIVSSALLKSKLF